MHDTSLWLVLYAYIRCLIRSNTSILTTYVYELRTPLWSAAYLQRPIKVQTDFRPADQPAGRPVEQASARTKLTPAGQPASESGDLAHKERGMFV